MPLSNTAICALETLLPGAVQRNVSLTAISRWRIGGTADVVVRPRTVTELAKLRNWLHARALPHVVIGAASNLLFADEGLRAVCVQIGPDFGPVTVANTTFTVGPGAWVPALARCAMQHGLSGIAHICGIPGTLGGLVCMNGGSKRKGIGEVVTQVTSVDQYGDIHTRNREDCGFAYRRSIFQTNGEAIACVTLELTAGANKNALRRDMLEILSSRRRKFPQKQPNCGSVFVSDPSMYADYGPPGAVIERLGLKGIRIGAAQVSTHHANFIVNTGAATAVDTLALIHLIRVAVERQTGYAMEVEARYVTEAGAVIPATSAAQNQTVPVI